MTTFTLDLARGVPRAGRSRPTNDCGSRVDVCLWRSKALPRSPAEQWGCCGGSRSAIPGRVSPWLSPAEPCPPRQQTALDHFWTSLVNCTRWSAVVDRVRAYVPPLPLARSGSSINAAAPNLKSPFGQRSPPPRGHAFPTYRVRPVSTKNRLYGLHLNRRGRGSPTTTCCSPHGLHPERARSKVSGGQTVAPCRAHPPRTSPTCSFPGLRACALNRQPNRRGAAGSVFVASSPERGPERVPAEGPRPIFPGDRNRR